MGVLQVEVVNKIVNKCKKKYGDRFEYYITGSYARNEPLFIDYDINIYDDKNDNKDWEDLLKMFHNIKESDGKIIDAQIDQNVKVYKRMSGDILYKNRNNFVNFKGNNIVNNKNTKILAGMSALFLAYKLLK